MDPSKAQRTKVGALILFCYSIYQGPRVSPVKKIKNTHARLIVKSAIVLCVFKLLFYNFRPFRYSSGNIFPFHTVYILKISEIIGKKIIQNR